MYAGKPQSEGKSKTNATEELKSTRLLEMEREVPRASIK